VRELLVGAKESCFEQNLDSYFEELAVSVEGQVYIME
jgi:hypothetical protein